jgi:acetyl esterase/lipase
MSASSVAVELHVHPGAPHGFDLLGLFTAIAKRAYADEIRVLQSV